RARLSDPCAALRRLRRSGLGGVARHRRARGLRPAARARPQARQSLPAAATAEVGHERRRDAGAARPRTREPGKPGHPALKPALSIVFFTVSSGAGLGLLASIALADVFAPGSLSSQVRWRGAALGLALVAAGLASSVLHLAKPRNAWRAFSRFRSSW